MVIRGTGTEMFRLALACSAILATGAEASSTLKLVSAFQQEMPTVGEQGSRFVDTFNAVSNNVKFEFYEPGALVPVSQSLEAVSEGHVDASFAVAGYWQGRMSSASLFSSFPFGFDAADRVAWLYEGNGLSLYQEMYDRAGYDVVVRPCGLLPAETAGWFKKRIDTLEDLDGLKMRVFGLGGEVLAKFGVEPHLLFADGITSALRTGELDAAEFSVIAADVYLGLHENTEFAYFPGWHQPSTLFELLINRNVWEDMAPVSQAKIDISCASNILENLAVAETQNQHAFEKVARRNATEFVIWNDDMLRAFEAAWEVVVAEHSARDQFFRTVWADITQFRQSRGEWNRVRSALE